MRHVQVLMATRNGGEWIGPQLDSIIGQRDLRVTILVSDDGSTDDTRSRIEDVARRHPDMGITVTEGPGRGAAANFLGLLAGLDGPADPVAFADQDDIWFPDKLARACDWLATQDPARPALYCSATELADAKGRAIGPSRVYHRPLALRNALVQNIVAGNTIVLNPTAAALLRRAGVPDVPFHDWWCYLVIAAVGGAMVFDPRPGLLYRQHPGNMQGANRGLRAGLQRVGGLAGRQLGRWSDANLAALGTIDAVLPDDSRRLIDGFRGLRGLRGIAAVRQFRALGLYRQRRAETLALMAAMAQGRV